ncbi:MAG: hypothetical protein IMY67_12250 [Bacteroidetes bacterium]|nr:hypothetical protein [Bacteroidota bacterium]
MKELHKKFEKKFGYLPDESIRIVHKHITDGKIGANSITKESWQSSTFKTEPKDYAYYPILFDNKIIRGNYNEGTYLDAQKCTYDFIDYINERMKEILK